MLWDVFGFYCERHWWRIHSAGVCMYLLNICGNLADEFQNILITVSCAIFCTRPRFRHDKWCNVRAFLFVSIGFYGCIKMTHLTEYWGGRPDPDARIGWNLMLFEGLYYFGGALVYAVGTQLVQMVPG